MPLYRLSTPKLNVTSPRAFPRESGKMNKPHTYVAREAPSIALLDDDFGSIVKTIFPPLAIERTGS